MCFLFDYLCRLATQTRIKLKLLLISISIFTGKQLANVYPFTWLYTIKSKGTIPVILHCVISDEDNILRHRRYAAIHQVLVLLIIIIKVSQRN